MPLIITPEQAIDRLKAVVLKGIRHEDYKRVCDLAKEYTAYFTGENIDELLIQYTPREDNDLFKQRVRVTQEVTPDIMNRLTNPMYKAARAVPTITKIWSTKEEDNSKEQNLNEAIKKFYGDESVDDYLSQRYAELNNTDPNAWIAIDFEGEYDPAKPNIKVEPYPVEVSASEAIDFAFDNNTPIYLTALKEVNGLQRYVTYLTNDSIVFQEITKDQLRTLDQDADVVWKAGENDDAKLFVITTHKHNAGKLPARRVGVKKDLKTRGRTCVPFVHSARPYLKKSIKAVSEFDLATCLHLFPQKIQYDEVCSGDLGNNKPCKDGRTVDGDVCKVCNGTGWKTHLSSADVIRVKLPKDPKDMVSLENFMAYKGPGLELMEFMKKYGLYELVNLSINAVYSSELLTPKSPTATATEILVDLDSVYDALKLYTDGYSAMNKHIVTVLAKFRNAADGFIYEHKFPKDFKMKPLTQLLDDLQKANSSGASSYVKREINKDIINKMYVDKPEDVVKINVKDKFFPFVGKTESEISNIITNGLTSKFNQVLYANFEQIFSELEEENNTETVQFYLMDIKKQRELVKAKVEQYIAAIEEEAAAARANTIGSFGEEGAAGSGDTQDYNPGDSVLFNGAPVEIVTANPGPDGGTYSIKLSDGTEQTVKGNQLTK